MRIDIRCLTLLFAARCSSAVYAAPTAGEQAGSQGFGGGGFGGGGGGHGGR